MGTPPEQTSAEYDQALAGEGDYWDNFIAKRLLRGEMPGSVDWRISFTQFRYNHDWRPFCLGLPGINFRMREIHYVLTTANRRPGMRVLDLGCGAGWLSLELARQGAHVTAFDISPTNLAIGRHMAETNARNFPFLYQRFAGLPCRLEDFGSVEYVYADLNTVTLPKGEYDAVVVWDSLHHIGQLERLLEQVRGALKPDGIFLGLDHAFSTPRTEDFNRAMYPPFDDFYAWLTATDPQWFYEGFNALCRQIDWGVLNVDYDATPVPGADAFLQQLFAELLEIIRTSLRQESLEKALAPTPMPAAFMDRVEESPFEDVSADRVIRVLLEEFQAVHFETVCPFIYPERHIPHYRTEPERIFQHYLSAAMIRAGEQAIARSQMDGQWFLFHVTRQRPSGPLAFAPPAHNQEVPPEKRLDQPKVKDPPPPEPKLSRVDFIYMEYLEAEVARKNAALADLEARLRQREAELTAARAPRLPWKRRPPRR